MRLFSQVDSLKRSLLQILLATQCDLTISFFAALDRIFNSAYHDSNPSERVKYGVLNIGEHDIMT